MKKLSDSGFTAALPAWRRNGLRLFAGAVLLQTAACSFAGAEDAVSIAPPQKDESVSTSHSETAVLAGGCFWGVQGVFQHVQGVKKSFPVMPAARPTPRNTSASVKATPGMPSRWR